MTERARQQRLRNVASIAEQRRSATHCKRGHEFTPENTYRRPNGGRRQCRTCLEDARFYANEALRRLMALDPDHASHGTYRGYLHGKCRCSRCFEAARSYRRSLAA